MTKFQRKIAATPTWVFLVVGLVAAAIVVVGTWPAKYALDFRVYHEAIRTTLGGNDPYLRSYTSTHLPYTYPPFSLMALAVLALNPATLVAHLWVLVDLSVSIALSTYILGKLTDLDRSRRLICSVGYVPAATLALQPLLSNCSFGQVNLILLSLVAIDVLSSTRSSSGVLVGLAGAIKIIPLAMVLAFVAQRRWAAATRAIATFGAASALAWVLLPSATWRYLSVVAEDPGAAGPIHSATNQSINGLVSSLIRTQRASTELWVLLSVLVVALGLVVLRRLAAQHRQVEVLIVSALVVSLVSPVSWMHHWSWVLLVPLVLFAGVASKAERVMLTVLVVSTVVGTFRPQDTWLVAELLNFHVVFIGLATLATYAVVETSTSTPAPKRLILTTKVPTPASMAASMSRFSRGS